MVAHRELSDSDGKQSTTPDGASAGEKSAARALTYAQWMVAAREEYARLLRLLEGLNAEQWRAPTDCPGWDVHAIAAHLAGAAAFTASLPEQLRQARDARRLAKTGDFIDRINQVQVQERRTLSPQELLRNLRANAERGLRARRRIPAPVRALRIPFGPPLGIRPLGYLVGRVYTRDAWMHRIDLSRATGAPLELTAEHDGAIIADIIAEWAEGQSTAYSLTLTGPAGGRWAGAPVGAANAAAVIEMDAVEFARVLSGREPGDGPLAHRIPF